MGLLLKILTAPVMAPAKSLVFIFEKINEQVNSELLDDSKIRQQLLELQMMLDNGEISEDEFYEAEEQLLDWMDAILFYKEQQMEAGG